VYEAKEDSECRIQGIYEKSEEKVPAVSGRREAVQKLAKLVV